jgi:hypothetical protein
MRALERGALIDDSSRCQGSPEIRHREDIPHAMERRDRLARQQGHLRTRSHQRKFPGHVREDHLGARTRLQRPPKAYAQRLRPLRGRARERERNSRCDRLNCKHSPHSRHLTRGSPAPLLVPLPAGHPGASWKMPGTRKAEGIKRRPKPRRQLNEPREAWHARRKA